MGKGRTTETGAVSHPGAVIPNSWHVPQHGRCLACQGLEAGGSASSGLGHARQDLDMCFTVRDVNDSICQAGGRGGGDDGVKGFEFGEQMMA